MMSALEDVHFSPGKIAYKINEVAALLQLKPYVLRYWETEFPWLRPQKDAYEQRRYRAADIELLQEIRRLLYEEKYTIAGARRQLETSKYVAAAEAGHHGGSVASAPAGPAPVMVNIERARSINQRLTELRRELQQLCHMLN